MSGSLHNFQLKDERLKAVFELLGECGLIADVGCDHGYLSAALILEGRARKVIASDISPASVAKASRLAASLGISDRMTVAEADGLSLLDDCNSPFKAAICGMGGELIAKLLERSGGAASRAELIVMQPMRGEAELRRYLYENRFKIVDERVVLDSGRYYQIIAAVPGVRDEIPPGFPKDWFRFGWVMASKPEPQLMPLLEHYKSVYEVELKKAEAKGRNPQSVICELEKTEQLIEFIGSGKARERMLLKDLLNAMEDIAPRSLALEYDNPGLIVGTRNETVSRVLVALDCTVPVVREAKALSCDLVLTHHPLLFHPVKHITPDDPVTAPVYELISNGIAMFAAHTNLDAAEGGVNTTLCRLLGIMNEIPAAPENICRVGELESEVGFSEFAAKVERVLNTKVRVSGPERPVKRIMVCGGSGGSEYLLAKEYGADVLVTGECKHNEAIEAAELGINVICAGHYETESIVLDPLVRRLSELTHGVEFIISRETTPLRTL